MTRLHWDSERTTELTAIGHSLEQQIMAIPGLRFAELAETGKGEGMIIAAYDEGHEYREAVEVAVFAEALGSLLTSKPHGHEGTVISSYGEAPSKL